MHKMMPSVPKEQPIVAYDPSDDDSDNDSMIDRLKRKNTNKNSAMGVMVKDMFEEAFLDGKIAFKTLAKESFKECRNDLNEFKKAVVGCQRILNKGKVTESICGKPRKKGSKWHFCERHDRERRKELKDAAPMVAPAPKKTKLCPSKKETVPDMLWKFEELKQMYNDLKKKEDAKAQNKSGVIIEEIFDEPPIRNQRSYKIPDSIIDMPNPDFDDLLFFSDDEFIDIEGLDPEGQLPDVPPREISDEELLEKFQRLKQ